MFPRPFSALKKKQICHKQRSFAIEYSDEKNRGMKVPRAFREYFIFFDKFFQNFHIPRRYNIGVV